MMNIIFLVVLLSVLINSANAFFTTIQEGYKGVHSILGQIQPKLINSSSMYMPLYSTIQMVKYVQDTDHVLNVKCVSKEGVDVNVPDIEIANKINPAYIIPVIKQYGFDYDKKLVVNPLAQYMRELCTQRTVDEIEITDFYKLDDLLKSEIQSQVDAINSGITIDYVRVTAISIPQKIKDKRLELAEEKAKKILEEEQMKRIQIEKDKAAMISRRDNEILATKEKQEHERKLIDAKAERERRGEVNAMLLEETKTSVTRKLLNAEAERDATIIIAQGVKELHAIPGYVELEATKAIANNTEIIYIGDKLPTTGVIGLPGLSGLTTKKV
jgi:regulator of protease activity HflC (stomatin/prohibitin superfamily)